jgi:translocator assembly and maintenance protein 41
VEHWLQIRLLALRTMHPRAIPLRAFSMSHSLRLDTERTTTSSPTPYPPPSSQSQGYIQPANRNPLSPPPVSARVPRKRITSVDQLPKTFGRNQIIAVPEQVQKDLEQVLADFKAPMRFAFAYGSGVFRQEGYTEQVRLYFHRRS